MWYSTGNVEVEKKKNVPSKNKYHDNNITNFLKCIYDNNSFYIDAL